MYVITDRLAVLFAAWRAEIISAPLPPLPERAVALRAIERGRRVDASPDDAPTRSGTAVAARGSV
ncbi:hypothetical protein [Amycolatopsis sp. CA-230715]|uniref:hypothetical protein n=1 Tax=Amycolatopsis sp. CA-230715 TaxID=2745196 RepID=UPI001C342EB9|nr:hypothetical protein [Amycolatopsis sp. CA-230715]QWF81606.1 hypothetical protein HUW46_05039 [Amycolatopsis sp. CA-230715]